MSDIHSDIYKLRKISRTPQTENRDLLTRFNLLVIAVTLMILTMIGVVVYNAGGWPGIAAFVSMTLFYVAVDRLAKPKS